MGIKNTSWFLVLPTIIHQWCHLHPARNQPHLVAPEAHALELKAATAGLVRAEVKVFQPGAEGPEDAANSGAHKN